jgi:hypothetical protein
VQQRLRDAVMDGREGEHELGGAGVVVAPALPQADERLRLSAKVVEQLVRARARVTAGGTARGTARVRGRAVVRVTWRSGRAASSTTARGTPCGMPCASLARKKSW